MIRFSRKASLNLSINAIVVLILAITMLGLGLGFITNLFGGATSGLTESLDKIEQQKLEQLLSTCSEEVCVDRNQLDVDQNSQEKILVVFNNPLSDVETFTITTDGDLGGCHKLGGDGSNCGFDGTADVNLILDEEIKVPGGQKKSSMILVETKPRTEAGTYVFDLNVESTEGGLNTVVSITVNVNI